MKLDAQKFALAGTTAYVTYLVLLSVIPAVVSVHGLAAPTIDSQNLFSLLVMCGINYVFFYVLAQSYNTFTREKKRRR